LKTNLILLAGFTTIKYDLNVTSTVDYFLWTTLYIALLKCFTYSGYHT